MKGFMIKWFLFFLSISVQCQVTDIKKIATVLKKMQSAYSSMDKYSLDVKYEFFRDANSKKVEDSYKGFALKYRANRYSKIKNVEFIEFKNTALKINHDEKAILYTSVSHNKQADPLEAIVKMADYFESSVLKEEKYTYVCIFSANKITSLPFTKMEVYINKKDFTIKKHILFLSAQNTFKNKKGEDIKSNPRMEVSYANFNTKPKNIAAIFALSKYVLITKKGVQPSNSLQGYQVIDATKK